MGCPQKLKGNSLVRKRPLFHDAGYMTALLDAPSDHHRKSGLGEFRIAKEHASDIGKIIAKLRPLGKHTRLVDRNQPWRDLHQRRSFQIDRESAPDGLILRSPVTSGFKA